MTPERNQPDSEPQKSAPSSTPADPALERRARELTPSPDSSDGRQAHAYTAPPRFDARKDVPGPSNDPVPTPVPKPKNWLLPVLAALVIAGGMIGVAVTHHSGGGSTPPPMVSVSSQNVLTVTGADVDQAATAEAIAELKAGTAGPLLASLPDHVKQEILSGDRKLYRIPAQAPQGAPAFESGDQISIDFNGIPYGTYDLSKPVTINMPLEIGDQIVVHCRSVASGRATLTADLATVLNPVHTQPLMKGQSQKLSVQKGAAGTNYDWFEQEANNGNAVAQYGLGHMYQYGLGVAQDRARSIHWYEQAAAQNYLDAKAQLQLLQSNP